MSEFILNPYAMFNYQYFMQPYYVMRLHFANCIPIAQVRNARVTRPFNFFERIGYARLVATYSYSYVPQTHSASYTINIQHFFTCNSYMLPLKINYTEGLLNNF